MRPAHDRRRIAAWWAFAPLLASLLVFPAAAAIPAGSPITQRFGPEDYGASPSLSAVAAAPGRLYVASADGVLVYDGTAWVTVPLPRGGGAGVVRVLSNGRVLVGGDDTFGRLEFDPLRGYRYVDLLAASGLPEAQRRVGVVWEFVENADGVFVQSEHFLHLLPADGGAVRVWPLGRHLRSILGFAGHLYAREEGRGLGRLRDGVVELLPGGDAFRFRPVAAVVGWGGVRYAVAADGLWQLGEAGVALVKPWRDGPLAVYSVAPLESGGFLLATLNGDLLWVDEALQVRQRVHVARQGLNDIARDAEGGVWAVTASEVFRLAMPSSWSLLSEVHGIDGRVLDTAEFDGALMVATDRSLQVLRGDGAGGVRAHSLPGAGFEVWDLHPDERGLLVARRTGLDWMKPGTTELLVLDDTPATLLAPALAQRDAVYAASDEELLLVRYREGWTVAGRWPLGDIAPSALLQRVPGELWLVDRRRPPQRWRFDLQGGLRLDATVFGIDRGLPDSTEHRLRLYLLDGVLGAWTDGEHYTYDVMLDRFVPAPTPAWIAKMDRPDRLAVVETPMGAFAYSPRDLLRRPAPGQPWERVQSGGWASTGFGVPRVSRAAVLRVPVWNGVLQYAPGAPTQRLPGLAIRIEHLRVRPAGSEWRPLAVREGVAELYSDEPMQLRVGLATLESGSQYRFRLTEGEAEFSDWSDRDLAIRGLEPGEYVLDVEARLPSQREIAPLQLHFRVLRRWYEEPILGAAAGLLFALLGLMGIREIGRRRLVRSAWKNRQLEQAIAERTAELEQANARLADMAVEDALTGVRNRRALEQALAREWARCGERGEPLAALMVDVDHFKRFNDLHGHLEGDRALVEIAALLGQGIQSPLELLARYGGEEFTLLLPHQPLESARQRAEQLRERIEQSHMGVTVSIGVAVAWPTPGGVPQTLLRRADQALYEAKRQGRNRVSCAGA